jgi:acetyl esterase
MPLDPQAKAILDAGEEAGGPSLEDMPLEEARAFADDLSDNFGVALANVASVETMSIPGPAGPIEARIVRPHGTGATSPVLIYYHGGGWVLGSAESHLVEAHYYANKAGCVVVVPGYRLAPEAVFPAAVDDCAAVLEWVAANATTLGFDAGRIAVGGDSAGGNLAAVVAQQALNRGGPGLCFQLLVYPVTDAYQDTESYRTNGEGYFLTKAMMAWFIETYLNDPIERDDSRVSPLRAADLSGLPPAFVVTAEYDPLHDEGEAYAKRLEDAGVAVEYRSEAGQIHGFMSMAGAIDVGRQGLDAAADALRRAFA